MNKVTTNNYETIRRFMIVQLNNAGVDSLGRMRWLQDIAQELTPDELAAIAAAITAWRNSPDVNYRAVDLVHDITGLTRRDDGFLPRIDSIAAAQAN